ncbi:MAG: hypothetical protein ABSG01_09050 [Anaerolineales bacterium]|jgi:hypothetical protein
MESTNEKGKIMTPASCTMCIYYSPDLKSADGSGICRRHPPTPYLLQIGPVAVWPTVRPMDWCADGEQGMSHDSLAAGKALIKKGDKGNGHRH